MQGKSLAQIFALTIGAVLIAIGVLGFFVEPSFTAGDSAQRGTLIFFDINGWHNVVHLLTGVVALALASTPGKARMFALGFGIAYALVTVLGFIVGDGGFLLSIIPINTADNLLHLAFAGAGIAIGMMSPAANTRGAVTA